MRCLSENFLHIDWDEEYDILYLEWIYYPGSEQYREGLTTALTLARKKEVRYWIANIPEPKQVPADDYIWLHETWLPELISLSIEKLAMVLPVDLIQEMSVVYLNKIDISVITFEIEFFDTTEKAYAWVKGPKPERPALHI